MFPRFVARFWLPDVEGRLQPCLCLRLRGLLLDFLALAASFFCRKAN
jgi:hypothetical protein